MKRGWLAVVLSAIAFCAFGQTAGQQADYQRALSAYRGNQFEQSAQLSQQLLDEYSAEDTFTLNLYLLLAKNYAILDQTERIGPLAEKIERILSRASIVTPQCEVWLLYLKGLSYTAIGTSEEAIQAFQQALAQAPGDNLDFADGVVPSIHNDLGYQLMDNNQPEQALFHLEKAYAMWQVDPGGNAEVKLVEILTNIGRVYKDLFQSDRAMRYSREAVRQAKQFFGVGAKEAVEAAANHALLLVQLDELAAAERTYQGLESYLGEVDGRTQSAILGNWGILYRQWEKYDQALEKMRAAANIDRRFLPEKNPAYVGSLINIAGIYFRTGRTAEVLPILYEADSLANLYGSPHHATIVGAIGLTFSQLDRPQAALEYIQKALAAATRTPEILPLSGWPNPPLDNFVVAANSAHLDYLRFKTLALWTIYESDPKEIYLEAAFDTYALLHDLLQKTFLYADIWQDNKLQTSLKYAMEGLLKTSYVLQEAGVDNRLAEVYTYLQQSKGLSIRVNTRELQTAVNSEVETALLDSLQKSVIRTEQSLFLAQRNPDRSLTDSLERDLLQLYDALESREESLPTGFLEVSDHEALQAELAADALFLETYLAPDGVYTLVISAKNLHLFFGESQRDIPAMIQEMRRALSDWSFIQQQPDSAKAILATVGHDLYQLLLDPILSAYPEDYQLMIAPNGMLAALPYAVLPRQSAGLTEQAYRNWPYLMQDYSLTYAYSATVWLDQRQHKAKYGRKYLAAFAPDYEQTMTIQENDKAIASLQRSSTWSLPFAGEEAQRICELIGGDLYAGGKATKENFWKTADQYRLLHLAMHGIAEQQDPAFSRLIFAADSTNQASVLYANELYSRRLNAELVVLSACNTGWGESVQSEGILSLGHAFSTAGVSATVITLWPVADAVGMQLVSNFYERLRTGDRKSQALQFAKQRFLERAASDLEGHPYFWAAYQLYGNDAAVAKNRFPWYTWGLAVLVGGLFVGLFWRRLQRT
ncbi:MAG TPA: CHAT domain-containing tetratricopeptide repeat protein [Saprospiraceae bacterium]|nr:CHAT domain-containing tetratricopeptide repeat protein [Saprospiraceae bacterium]